jgi:hypothetical protein
MGLMHGLSVLTPEVKLCLAPIEDPRRFLDVGTGTGIWAIDFANIYPNTHFAGAGLSESDSRTTLTLFGCWSKKVRDRFACS